MKRSPVVLITGASSGIGAALAHAWAKRDAKLVLNARGAQPLVALARELKDKGADVLAVPGDVSDATARAELMARTMERFGGLDVLVNNAGRGFYAPVESARTQDLEDLFALNVIAPVALAQAALEPLCRAKGTIVMMSSIAGLVALPRLGAYAASKFALEALSMALRAELASRGVKVLVVRPGPVDTPFRANATRYDDRATYNPLGRRAQSAEDVAERTIVAVEHNADVLETSASVKLSSFAARTLPGALRLASRIMAKR